MSNQSKPVWNALGHTAVGLTELFLSIYQNPKYRKAASYTIGGSAILTAASIGLLKYWNFKQKLEQTENSTQTKNRPKAKVDGKFLERLKLLLNIVVPGVKSKEFLQLIALSVVVIARTLISNWLSSLSGDVSKTLIELDFREFCRTLALSSLLSIGSALLAPTLKYLINKLSLEWRISLTKHIHTKYLRNMMYYKTAYLNTDVGNPDQCITQDVEKFTEGMCSLYSNLVKPIADVLLYTYQLVNIAGTGGPLAIVGYTSISFILMTILRPPFSSMTSKLQNMEGKFRYCHIRTATNGESIAFYGGDELEKSIVDNSFKELYDHKKSLVKAHLYFGIFNDFFVFNLPQCVSWLIAMVPVFFGNLQGANQAELARQLRYLAAVISHEFQALGEIITLNTRLSEIAGYTANVCNLLETIDEIDKHDVEKRDKHFELGDTIKFENVTLVTPADVVLAKHLTFEVKPMHNLLVTGPNGTGKSSLFRILGGLWYIQEGIIKKPGGSQLQTFGDIYYVPQKPYNALGTLRDQIIYPEAPDSTRSRNMTNDELIGLLKRVRIDYIVEREGGFDIVKNWDDILSLGEQQRLAMARLFYHRPKYAILDECTSAVSVDIEKNLYQQCKDENITCVTISLRPALKPYHTHELSFDGEGGWKIEEITEDQL
ncbi:peroxisomal ABC transporter D family member [Acrasis kona]|uniref:Peroxisomal ABC transporter D family member n=1 Tax=Acrasis kona TaxID=1008807 RepID=A0AAW2YP25_9EUKA